MSAAGMNGKPYNVGAGILRHQIEAATAGNGVSMAALTVLATQNDPYRLDTPANHVIARWFADAIGNLVPDGRAVHLRGLHYRLISSTAFHKPGGLRYQNTQDDWEWLSDKAAKAARWLGYVPFELIADERNAPPSWSEDEPENAAPFKTFIPRKAEVFAHGVDVPSLEDVLPALLFSAGIPRQPYRIALIGEKTSLHDVLKPVQRMVGGDLLLPTGESTDTLLFQLARRASADGRPLIVLYFTDFDPSGWQMPVSAARKLQAFRDLLFPDLQFRVYAVALTVEQCIEHGLPESFLKETERRGANWRAKWGREQTEIDALAALRPEVLREIAEQAVRPFFDRSLRRRSDEANGRWEAELRARLPGTPDFEDNKAAIEYALREVESAAASLEVWQDRANTALIDALNDGVLPPAPAETAPILMMPPTPLCTTDDDFATASRKLIDRKRLIDGAAE